MDPVIPPLHKRIGQRMISVQDWFGKLFSLTRTADLRKSFTEDVPVLRANHPERQVVLPGVRKAAPGPSQ